MLITKGGVSFRGQPELLKYSGISSFGSSDLTKSLISSRPYLSISLSEKNNNNNNPQTVMREVRGSGREKQYGPNKPSSQGEQLESSKATQHFGSNFVTQALSDLLTPTNDHVQAHTHMHTHSGKIF